MNDTCHTPWSVPCCIDLCHVVLLCGAAQVAVLLCVAVCGGACLHVWGVAPLTRLRCRTYVVRCLSLD